MNGHVQHNVDSFRDIFKGAPKRITKALKIVGTFANTRIGAQSVSKYMRDAKGEGRRREGDSGPLRIMRAVLARATASKRQGRGNSKGWFSLRLQGLKITMEKGVDVPGAAAHEFGFDDEVKVPEHVRRLKRRKDRKRKEVNVRAHVRRMRIPKRSFLAPALHDQAEAIEEKTADEVRGAVFG